MPARCYLDGNSAAAELSRRGWELGQAGEKESALACHELATAAADAGALQWFHRARAEQALNDEGSALRSYERAVELGETLPISESQEAYFQLGRLYRDASKLSASADAYRATLRLGPNLPGAHVMLAVVLREQERPIEALHHYDAGLAIQPAIAAAQYNRAQTLLSLMRAAEALAGFEAAVRLDPSFALAYTAIGDAHGTLANHAAAGEAHAVAAALQPQSASAQYALGKVQDLFLPFLSQRRSSHFHSAVCLIFTAHSDE